MASAIEFPEMTRTATSDSGEANPLPMAEIGDVEVTAYRLTPEEKAEIARTGIIWLRLKTKGIDQVQWRKVLTSREAALRDA